MSRPTLIFDLDDTLFETRSIDPSHVEPIIQSFIAHAGKFYSSNELERIIKDLWKLPFDSVANKYQFEESLQHQFTNAVNGHKYDLDINVFDDYHYIQEISHPKLLVTTGFRKLQLAKIEALGLETHFDQIFVDEIDSPERIYKKGIFCHILDSSKSDEHFIIGDNPDSELKAGHQLGLTTIQVAKFGQPKSKYVNHYITHFQSLKEIIRNA